MDLLIKNAQIIQPGTPLHGKIRDLLIRDGKFEKIASNIPEQKGIQTFRYPDLKISTGWMDMRVSFGEPGYEERETLAHGLKVAAYSGFTAIALMPGTNPPADHRAAVKYLIEQSAGSPVSVYPVGALTKGMKGQEMAEMYDMSLAGAVAFGDGNHPTDNPQLLKVALQYAQAFDGLLMSFPQDTALVNNAPANESDFTVRLGLKGNPGLAETTRISRDSALLEYTGGKLHIPLITTRESAKLIRNARRKGLDISCSVSVHHLILTDRELEHFDTRYKVDPPLRQTKDTKALRKAVTDGTVCCIVSDHRPLDIEVKKKEFALAEPGTIGLESFFGALNTVLSPEDFIPLITENPRKRLGINLPAIEEGEKADITLFETRSEWSFDISHVRSTSKNSAFYGKKMKGKALGIIHNNQLVLHSS